jgi:predicted nucleic acid-binding protein
MRVIADTTPLRYLVVLGHVELLPTLFGQILIPPAVAGELHHPQAPAVVRAWVARPPSWLTIRASQLTPDARLLALDAGEREAILLAQELQATLFLVDEQEGRKEAARRDLTTMGTLRVLELAAERGLVDFPTVLSQLQAARFYVTPEMVQELLARDARRKQQP